MCTAIVCQAENGEVVMGRTMDFSYPLAPEWLEIPAGYLLPHSEEGRNRRTRYAFQGIGQDLPPVSFADGVNEMGLGAAALYFPGYAQYDDPREIKNQNRMRSIGVIMEVLGNCAAVSEAIWLFQHTGIVGEADSITGAVAPLHWILADRTGACVTIEKTKQGLSVLENPIGVLANSPSFSWQMTNLRNYRNVRPQQGENAVWAENVFLAPFGQAAGTMGLPGDFTSPGRFVRTAWIKSHTEGMYDGNTAIQEGFRILGNVSIPRGCVMTDRGTPDYTQYIVMYHLSAYQCYQRQ